jgi:hypothetical protein
MVFTNKLQLVINKIDNLLEYLPLLVIPSNDSIFVELVDIPKHLFEFLIYFIFNIIHKEDSCINQWCFYLFDLIHEYLVQNGNEYYDFVKSFIIENTQDFYDIIFQITSFFSDFFILSTNFRFEKSSLMNIQFFDFDKFEKFFKLKIIQFIDKLNDKYKQTNPKGVIDEDFINKLVNLINNEINFENNYIVKLNQFNMLSKINIDSYIEVIREYLIDECIEGNRLVYIEQILLFLEKYPDFDGIFKENEKATYYIHPIIRIEILIELFDDEVISNIFNLKKYKIKFGKLYQNLIYLIHEEILVTKKLDLLNFEFEFYKNDKILDILR